MTGSLPSAHLPRIDERVRLKTDLPNLELHSGEVGSVCSVWAFSDEEAYEVEFQSSGMRTPTRAILKADQIEPEAINTGLNH